MDVYDDPKKGSANKKKKTLSESPPLVAERKALTKNIRLTSTSVAAALKEASSKPVAMSEAVRSMFTTTAEQQAKLKDKAYNNDFLCGRTYNRYATR